MEVKIINKQLLDQYPVWKWNESNDARCPVLNSDPLPEDEPILFIKARFHAPGGEKFDGYLTGRETFYAFALFVGAEIFQFNLNLPKLAREQWSALCGTLGKPEMSLFPLHYEADAQFANKPKIGGAFMLST